MAPRCIPKHRNPMIETCSTMEHITEDADACKTNCSPESLLNSRCFGVASPSEGYVLFKPKLYISFASSWYFGTQIMHASANKNFYPLFQVKHGVAAKYPESFDSQRHGNNIMTPQMCLKIQF